jgi:hypothetical protein
MNSRGETYSEELARIYCDPVKAAEFMRAAGAEEITLIGGVRQRIATVAGRSIMYIFPNFGWAGE